MIISFIDVGNLNKFLEYLRLFGIEIEEYYHMVLTDSSEFEIIICRKNSKDIAYIAVHYIDTHYAVLSSLRDNASDKEILETLLSIDRKRLWRIPVEPMIYITNSYEFIKIIMSYLDEVPEEGRVYLEKYLNSNNNAKKYVIDINILLSMIIRLKDEIKW